MDVEEEDATTTSSHALSSTTGTIRSGNRGIQCGHKNSSILGRKCLCPHIHNRVSLDHALNNKFWCKDRTTTLVSNHNQRWNLPQHSTQWPSLIQQTPNGTWTPAPPHTYQTRHVILSLLLILAPEKQLQWQMEVKFRLAHQAHALFKLNLVLCLCIRFWLLLPLSKIWSPFVVLLKIIHVRLNLIQWVFLWRIFKHGGLFSAVIAQETYICFCPLPIKWHLSRKFFFLVHQMFGTAVWRIPVIKLWIFYLLIMLLFTIKELCLTCVQVVNLVNIQSFLSRHQIRLSTNHSTSYIPTYGRRQSRA